MIGAIDRGQRIENRQRKEKRNKKNEKKVQKQAAFKSFTILFKLDFLVSMVFRRII